MSFFESQIVKSKFETDCQIEVFGALLFHDVLAMDGIFIALLCM